ncbi:bifunctional glutamate N-acetyltransferase/amino-acid acetyltransferase ArgJ [Actinomycetospora sp. TBRC 11914]|uniref:bifunctional glutamate N-acetyltransferase/amino-acid acetyltransferase ArgJ n=1 Tax=Actinomycetospora sp. TBRC 11914 TaxID=2729387 RepID=UPI00145C5D3B|nr:bifunctional glutamate N-acetyltransferase/amino-acid acetyltransferase ArgJ [Actinomycetospora sp. TBRC 11914]NMO94066.1 bifunctional glutamate N-acetyltransferase/amino-acid acetyltransferase ArgJ [Actinomycetospora sp. TBRC 11914]
MSVTAAAGFRAAGVRAGLRAHGDRPDLALVVNDGPRTTAAGVFTRNQVKAAPVLWSQQVLREQSLRAVVLNSGGANACTGPDGFADTHHTAEKVAEVLGCGAIEVAVCSTGLIGERLPIDRLLAGVDTAAGTLDAGAAAGSDAATAVLTTDTVDKQAARTAADGSWTVGGFAKGAGMMAPSLATMLVVLTTDAVLEPAAADRALRAATAVTFDRLDIDGSTSTNDTVLLLASGASGAAPGEDEFTEALRAVCADLARGLQADAEGVTKRIAVTVTGADSDADALLGARAVARDSLVKTALFGSDPNWGRIAAAVGASEARVEPATLSVTVNGVLLCAAAAAVGDRSKADLSGPEITVEVDLGLAAGTATVLTTDLSHAYVEENSAYST